MVDIVINRNDPQILDDVDQDEVVSKFYKLTDGDEKLVSFVLEQTDSWREYRNANYLDNWLKYERIWRGEWSASDKLRKSERSRIISPATQQAVETRHAEIMEAIFGQGEFFDIVDNIEDQNGPMDVAKIKAMLAEDFKRDKIRKSFDQITLMGEIYGTMIGEIVIGEEDVYTPMEIPLGNDKFAHGTTPGKRTFVRLNPVNPKNFLFDPNGTEINNCLGCAIEKYVSIHTIQQGIKNGKYLNVDIEATYSQSEKEELVEAVAFDKNKGLLLTYYGLVPREYLTNGEGDVADSDDYSDMVEAIVVIANGGLLLKREESPYMMKDRPVLTAQSDTVPNRILGRGTVEKAFNMQSGIDGSMRSHLDSLALTNAPMFGIDATKFPRGKTFEAYPGNTFFTNGPVDEIITRIDLGITDSNALAASKEFERMLLMATGTIDSAGSPSQVSRDGDMDMATATMIKKYKRVLVNFQEDFLIPFINKSIWRRMQYDAARYPSVDVTFIPTGTLGIIAREHEQKQIAFLIQTLGAQSPLTPVLMKGILHNSSHPQREELIAQLGEAMKPDPATAQAEQQKAQGEAALNEAKIAKIAAEIKNIEQDTIDAPSIAKAKLIAALSTNLQNGEEDKDFDRRYKISKLMLEEKAIDNTRDISENQLLSSMSKGQPNE